MSARLEFLYEYAREAADCPLTRELDDNRGRLTRWRELAWSELTDIERGCVQLDIGGMIGSPPMTVCFDRPPSGELVPPAHQQWVRVDWRASDKALRATFEMLLRTRPQAFESFRKVPLHRAGAGGEKLPHDYEAMLGWLEVYRARKRHATWRDYYEATRRKRQAAHGNPEQMQIEEDWIRSRRRDRARAREIIAWVATL